MLDESFVQSLYFALFICSISSLCDNPKGLAGGVIYIVYRELTLFND